MSLTKYYSEGTLNRFWFCQRWTNFRWLECVLLCEKQLQAPSVEKSSQGLSGWFHTWIDWNLCSKTRRHFRFAQLSSFGHVWTQSQPRCGVNQAEVHLKEVGRSRFDSIWTPGRFVCSDNTTQPTTGTSDRDMCCRATGSNRLLVIMDSLVLYLLLHKPPLFPLFTRSFRELFSSAQIIDEAFHLLAALS